MSRPFLWGWLFAALAGVVLLIRLKASRARPAILVAFGVATAMFLAEAAAAMHNARRPTKGGLTSEYSPRSLTRLDNELGWVLNPGARVSASRKWSDSTLFRVTYTINDAGMRGTRGNPRGETWLFVGCSFTFGEGVEDDETLPARFSEQLGWRANIVNLGVTGYGAHQVLRLLESGRVAGVGRPVRHVIYQALPDHVKRAAGKARWDVDGPAYAISGDSIRFTGPFHSSAGINALNILRKSDLGQILDRRYRGMPPSDAELELYVRIVQKVAVISEKELGARFSILFWDDDGDRTAKRVFDRLVATGLPVIRTTSIMTRGELDSLRFPHDNHPTPEAYRRLAPGAGRPTRHNSKGASRQ